MVDAAQQPARDRGRGAQQDDEDDGPLAELEEQDGEGEPGDGGHRLEAEDGRADRLAKHRHAGHQQPQDAAQGDGEQVPLQGAPERDPHPDVEVELVEVFAQALEHRQRAGKHVVGPPAGPDHELPGEQAERGRGQLRPGAAPGANGECTAADRHRLGSLQLLEIRQQLSRHGRASPLADGR